MKTVVRLLLLFALAQIIGVGVLYPYLAGQGDVFSYGEYEVQDIFFMIIGGAFAVILLLVVMRFYKGDLLYRLLEFLLVFAATFVVFYSLTWYADLPDVFAFILSFLLAGTKFIEPRVRNISATVSSIGVAVMFSLFLSLQNAILFILVMCVYDYVAVFVTRHMITMATEFGRRDMSFSVAAQQKVMQKVDSIDKKGHTISKYEEKTERLELGTGDIALPLAFNLVVFKSVMPYGLGPAISSFIILATFSTMSIALVLSYVQKRKLFLPALPPIILGTTIGYLIGYVCGIIII